MKISGFTIELEDRNALEYALSIKPDDAELSSEDQENLRDRITVLATLYDSSALHNERAIARYNNAVPNLRSRRFCSAPFNSEEKYRTLQALFGSILGAAFELVASEEEFNNLASSVPNPRGEGR